MEETEPHKANLRSERLTAATVGLAGFVAVLATSGFYGMCWDEGYYYPAYEDVWRWIVTLFSHPVQALSAEGITGGWGLIHELPPVTKWLGAPLTAIHLGGNPLLMVRLFPAALFGATLSLIYNFSSRFSPKPWALLAALAYALHPRVFGHAHFAATETLFAFLTVLAAFIASSGVEKWGRRIALAAVAGLALATKVNGIILIGVLMTWLLTWRLVSEPGNLAARPRSRKWRLDALTALLLPAVAALVAFLLWPWMWHDTAARIGEYWSFVSEHSHQGVWYLGRKWNYPLGEAPLAPWHYPIVMTLVTSPVTFILLVGAAILALVSRSTKARWAVDPSDWLLLGLLAAPMIASSLPSSPKYDGMRLFFPAFAPAALLVAKMGDGVKRKWIAAIAALLALETMPFLSAGLSFYNVPVRLLAPKGTDFPFEETYWQESFTPRVLREVDELLGTGPHNIKTLALHPEVFDIQKEWGTIPSALQFDGEPPCDAHLLQNRKGFWGNTEWWLYANREPLAVWPPDSSNPRVFLYDGRPPGSY